MPTFFSDHDHAHMRSALDLARTGQGRVAPNPPVGCVIVGRDGVVAGRGWHDRLGGLHAEAMALREAGEQARGATVYVTLSPCTTHGRQPPCAAALLRAGVAEVVVAADDPNSVNANGAAALRAGGIVVRGGLLQGDAERLAKGFFKVQRRGLPYLTLKYAMTLDGKIAASSGDSRWVSGPESRELVMDMRSRADAVLIGSGTALADDPRLTVRDPVWSRRGGAARHRQPLRVVADGRARVSPGAALLRSAADGGDSEVGGEAGGEVVIAVSENADAQKFRALTDAGARVLPLPAPEGRLDLAELLRRLAGMGVNEILCEGGAGLAASLLRAGLVDEIVAFVAPKIIGGAAAPGPVGGLGIEKMAMALPVRGGEWRMVGPDLLFTGLVERAAAAERAE